MADALFVLSQLALVAFGLPVAFHPSLRGLPLLARTGAAFLFGAFLLSAYGTLLSLLGLQWTLWSLALPLLLLGLALGRIWSRRAAEVRRLEDEPAPAWFRFAAIGIMMVTLADLAVRLVTGRATSVDFIFFWGVKALRFAAVGGIEHELLSWIYAIHTHPNYPPLYPVTLAWGVLVTHRLPWIGAVLTCLLWLLCAAPVIFGLLRLRLGERHSLGITTFWTAAFAISLGQSICGGNAESVLLSFLSVAIAALLIEWRDDDVNARTLAAISMAGAIATKNEAVFAWILLTFGAVARDALWRKARIIQRAIPLLLLPAITYLLWLGFELVYDIPLRDPTREPGWALHPAYLGPTLLAMVRELDAGSFWLAWLLPAIFLILPRSSESHRLTALPAFLLTAGLLLAFLVYYLHTSYDPTELIGWTLPRVSQPALSAWILGLAAGWSSRPAMR